MVVDTAADGIELTLSSTGKSIVVRKDARMWMQTVAEVKNVFRGVPINICMIRRISRTEENEFVDCRNGIILKQDRTRIHTWVDRKKYTCTVKQLRRLLDEEIKALTMAKYTGRIRKLEGMAG